MLQKISSRENALFKVLGIGWRWLLPRNKKYIEMIFSNRFFSQQAKPILNSITFMILLPSTEVSFRPVCRPSRKVLWLSPPLLIRLSLAQKFKTDKWAVCTLSFQNFKEKKMTLLNLKEMLIPSHAFQRTEVRIFFQNHSSIWLSRIHEILWECRTVSFCAKFAPCLFPCHHIGVISHFELPCKRSREE